MATTTIWIKEERLLVARSSPKIPTTHTTEVFTGDTHLTWSLLGEITVMTREMQTGCTFVLGGSGAHIAMEKLVRA